MIVDQRPNKIAFIDFETQSECDLTSSTARKYAAHRSTRVLTCVVKVDGQEHRMGPYLDSADLAKLEAISRTHTLCAHNALFDAAVWEEVLRLPEAKWCDTLPMCRASGLPGMLERVGQVLFNRGKDPNGKRLIDMLCIVRNGRYPAVGPAHALLLDYNARDVELLEQVYGVVKGSSESDVVAADYAVNRRGIPVDKQLLTALRDMYTKNEEKYEGEFSELTGGVNPRSPTQMRAWMASQGFVVDGVNKAVVQALMSDPDDFFAGDDSAPEDKKAAFETVLEVLAVRREVSGVGAGKVDAAVSALDDDDRIREQFVYWGAHTGRWASRRLQLHNMPSAIKGLDVRTVEPVYEAVAALAVKVSEDTKARVSVGEVLSNMLRRLVSVENLITADYGSVEARCLAWMADEEAQLAAYRDPHGKSVYIDMAEKLFGRSISKDADPIQYTLAKAIVLGCGYGMSGAKFGRVLANRESKATVQAFYDSGLDPGKAVKMYRAAYPKIVKLWKDAHEAVHAAVAGEEQYCGKCWLYMQGANLMCKLPSGRCIVYRNARVEPRVPGYCAMYGMPEVPVPTVVYDGPKHGGFLYGSKWVENADQGICRDLLAGALVEAESSLTPIIHVHDEIACDNDDSKLEELLQIMSTPPDWAEGFPVLVEGYSGKQWSKNTKGYRKLNAINGRLFL